MRSIFSFIIFLFFAFTYQKTYRKANIIKGMLKQKVNVISNYIVQVQ